MPPLPPLLPAPRRIEPGAGAFALRDGVPIVLGPAADDRDFAAARGLAAAVRARCGVRLPVETHAARAGLGPHLALARRAGGAEAYRIEVEPSGVRVEADGAPGLGHALKTLAQLVGRGGRIPACRIEDAPDFAWRGVMLDVSRGKVPTAASLFALVDVCARLKLNVLMLYVEHVFRFRRHPQIGAGDSPLDAETLRGLDAYAAERHVELVPSLQSLGHMEHVLALDRYAPLAESDARWTLAPVDPGSYALLGDLYAEYLPNFRSPLFNANCDEPWDLGRGRSAARDAELGPGGLWLEHVRRVRDLAAAHGKRTLVWGDFVHAHPARIPELDRDLVLLDWWYEAQCDFDRVRAFAENGIAFWVCPGTSSWNCLFPRTKNALANITGWADAGRRHGADGLLVTDWGDFGHYNLQGNSWLGFAWAAQQAWSGAAPAADFDRAFSRLFFGDASGEAARCYRELGDVHEAGFPIWNGSALQFLYFDDLDAAFFLEAAREPVLRRSQARLARARRRLARARARFGADALTHEELLYAADASLLALRKARAALPWVAWRRGERRLDAAARRRLAAELRGLAREQAALGRTLCRLWLRRAEPSNLSHVQRRLSGSIRSLRRAAAALARNRPTPPPPPHPGVTFGAAIRALRDSVSRAGSPGAGAARRRATTRSRRRRP
jgi:hypothetical protein